MRTASLALVVPALLLSACGGDPANVPRVSPAAPPAPIAPPPPVAATSSAWKYPSTKVSDASDTYFGKTIKDPFRLLENLKDPEIEAWFKAQATLTDSALDAIPGRDVLLHEWLGLDKLKPATYGGFQLQGGRLFYKKTLGGENVGKLFVREGWSGVERLAFDTTAYKSDVVKTGATTTLEGFSPSWDGKYVALSLSAGGAEYSEIRVLDLARKSLLPESVYPAGGVLGWLPGGRAFTYDACNETDIKSPSIELNRHTRLHKVGTPFATDTVVFGNENNPELRLTPKEFAGAAVDERTPRFVFAWASTVENELKVYTAPAADLGHKKLAWTSLAQPSDNIVRGLEFCGGDFVCAVTHTGAPHYKVVRTSVHHPDWAHAETIIPEAADSIQSLTRSKNFLLVVYSNGVVGRIARYDLAKKTATDVPLPASGDVSVSCPDTGSDRCIVFIEGWTSPKTLYDFDAGRNTMQKSVFNSDVTYPGFDRLVTDEVEVPGHDGTMIPLSIVHEKGLAMDGTSSCILDGYGAYGISYTPWFRLFQSTALHGVVLAFAHPRGGSEKGEAWYRAGYKTTKPNTWKDFISSAEYLVQKGYTSKEKLAGTGTSAGGILISRAITERPDLFAAAVCNVGVANATRAEFSPNGPVNTPEFGTVTDPAEAAALLEMDGVQHVQPGVKYPAVLGVSGWNDPRVAPWETGKFIAALQVASVSGRPTLLKVNYDNGHFTEEKQVTFKNFAGQFAFMLWQTGHKEFQPVAAAR